MLHQETKGPDINIAWHIFYEGTQVQKKKSAQYTCMRD